MNTTYCEGYELAGKDIKRFGVLFAMDKLHLLTGDLEKGYADRIALDNKCKS